MTEQDIIARLLKKVSNCASVNIIDNAIETIEKLVKERDEARKIVCQVLQEQDSGYVTCKRLAEDRGWNCYDRKETQ